MAATVHIKTKLDKPLRRRHPWVFSGAVARIEGSPEPGEIAACRDAAGEFLAWGTVNPKGRIAFRAFSFDENEALDGGLIARRIASAVRRRLPLIPPATNGLRLVHSEADGLPGLTVDRYGAVLSCQITTAGMLRFKEDIARALEAELSPVTVIARVPGRPAREESVAQGVHVLLGEKPDADAEFTEHGVPLQADVVTGQKTGFYFDQRDTRQLVRELASGRRVLDCYSYTGATGVNAALGGAALVTCVDSSGPALDRARAHFQAGGIPESIHRTVEADAPRFLAKDDGEPWDVIVLDPPPLAPGRAGAKSAFRLYREINARAMRRLSPGGLLLTFSCSRAVDAESFSRIAFSAALDAAVDARVLRRLSQPFDHPVSVYHPEGEYLRGLLLQIVPAKGTPR